MADFETAYEQHLWDVYGFFAYRVGCRADAEDLTQRTFERALRAWGRYDERRASVRTWLFAIATNLLVDHYRADQSARLAPLELSADRAAPLVEPELGLAPELAAALAQLTVRDRQVVALRYGGDLNGPEIAELMGLTLANVQQILSRALRRMRALIDGEAVAPAGAAVESELRGAHHAGSTSITPTRVSKSAS